MTPSERERRIKAAVESWITAPGDFVYSRMGAALDAADEAVTDREADAYEFWAAEARSEAQRAERAEAAARDFWKALRILDDWHHDEPTYLLITEVRDRHPSFSGEEGTGT